VEFATPVITKLLEAGGLKQRQVVRELRLIKAFLIVSDFHQNMDNVEYFMGIERFLKLFGLTMPCTSLVTTQCD
jgi:hypothetical protein